MGVRTKRRVNPIGGNNAGAEVIDANQITEDPNNIKDNENVLIPPHITSTKKQKKSGRQTKKTHTTQTPTKQKSFFEWLFS
jgi:hypothetical protein